MAETFEELLERRRFFRAASQELRESEGWFRNVLKLGLLYFVPVFGQITVEGFSWEWARRAAWKDNAPLPAKIYGRPESRMLLWGWYALVIGIAFMLVPDIVFQIGNHMEGTPLASALLELVGTIGMVFMGVLSWVGCMLMMMWGRLGAGFDLKRVWGLAKRDSGGLWAIFGWNILCTLLMSIAVVVVYLVLALSLAGTVSVSYTFTAAGLSSMLAAVTPAVLVSLYLATCFASWLELVTARAVGHWFARFGDAASGKEPGSEPGEREGDAGSAKELSSSAGAEIGAEAERRPDAEGHVERG